MISGPKAAPNPAQALATSPRTCESGFAGDDHRHRTHGQNRQTADIDQLAFRRAALEDGAIDILGQRGRGDQKLARHRRHDRGQQRGIKKAR
jgi:hypothetical protein